MAKRRNKLTPNQQAFKKEINRIKRAVSRAEKKGYIFEESVIPQMPKRVTQKALQKIQNYKTPQIYKSAEKLDKSTGELTPGENARKQERQETARKSAETRRRKKQAFNGGSKAPTQEEIEKAHRFKFTDIVIQNYNFDIEGLPDFMKRVFVTWRDALISQVGRDDFAELLQNMAEDGFVISDFFDSDIEKIKFNLSKMLDYLPENGVLTNEYVTDALEQLEDWELPD